MCVCVHACACVCACVCVFVCVSERERELGGGTEGQQSLTYVSRVEETEFQTQKVPQVFDKGRGRPGHGVGEEA